MKRLLRLTLAGLALLTLLPTPSAQAWTYQDGDVILIFRGISPAPADDVEVDIGNVSQFTNHPNGYSVPVTGWDPSLVTNTFGAVSNANVILTAAISSTSAWVTSASTSASVLDVTPSTFQSTLYSLINSIGSRPTNDDAVVGTNSYVIAESGGLSPNSSLGSYYYIVTGGGAHGNAIADFGGNVTFDVQGAAPTALGFWQIQPSTVNPKPAAAYIGTFVIDINGTLTFTAGPAAPQIEVLSGTNILASGQSTNFGTVLQGQSSAPLTFTVNNTGSQPLILTNITVPPGFILGTNSPSTITNFPFTIAPFSSGTFGVQLDSTTAGVYSGDVSISANDPSLAGSTFSFAVSGTVIAPSPLLEVFNGTTNIANGQTTPVDFGSAQPGQAEPVVSFTVTNAGNETLDLEGITVPAGFTLNTNYPATIAAGSNGVFSVQLNTATAGFFSGNITITDNNTNNSTFSFAVTGTVASPEVISLAAFPTNGGTVSGGGVFLQGTTNTVTAAPGSNYVFSNWTTNGVVASTSNIYSFTLISNETLVANFLPLYTLTATSVATNAGTVSVLGGTNGVGTFPAGTLVEVQATAGSGFAFTGWTGNATGTNNPLFVQIYTNLGITANFASNSEITLTVTAVGSGIVTPDENGKILKAGSSVTLKAVPSADSGAVFSNWTGTITSDQNPLKLTKIESSLVLQANFVPNPFPQFAGAYNGIFWDTNNIVTETNAGLLKSLTVTAKGTYSGSLLFDGTSKSISGTFNLGGHASNSISLGGKTAGQVQVVLTLTNNPAPQVTGTVSGAGWESTLTAYLVNSTLPSAEYDLLLLPDTNAVQLTNAPGGSGYALITNHVGAVKITGALADGTSFSQSVSVSQDSFVPIYANLYSSKGLLLGWINLTNSSGDALYWVHPVVKSGLFTSAFASTNQVLLSTWTNPPVFSNLPTNLFLEEISGNVPAGTNEFTISIGEKTFDLSEVSGPVTPLTGSIAAKTGLLKVTVGSGAAKTSGYGVVLLNGSDGGGYFLSKTNAGSLILSP